MNEPIVLINPQYKGSITCKDLLSSEGTMSFYIDPGYIPFSNGIFFKIQTDDFLFSSSVQNRSIIFQRNKAIAAQNLSEFLPYNIPIGIFLVWRFTSIAIHILVSQDIHKIIEIPTEPSAPPLSLIKWARIQSLLPVDKFDSVEQFRDRAHTSILQLRDKIEEADAYQSFWNIEYSGHKIKSRTPKREPEIQPIIQCILSDQMLLSGIELIRESKTGVGLLDFLLQCYVNNKGISKICIEAKLAHSENLEHGLLIQLPQYMRSTNSEYGIYLVINYRGEWFEKPIFINNESIDTYLTKVQNKSTDPLVVNNVRIMFINLSKPKTASKA